MALTEIEYGSLASSEVINNNFEYLDNKITGVSETVSVNNAAISSNIASINSSIESMSNEINESIETMNTKLGGLIESGCFITTYINGTSWYREYFSDAEKKVRVWLEQGGVANVSQATATITLPKAYNDTKYCVLGSIRVSSDPNIGIQSLMIAPISKTQIKGYMDWITNSATLSCTWYTCGK